MGTDLGISSDNSGGVAESIILDLGIANPGDIDVEAIAFDSGISVVYEALSGCEAMLVGCGDRAIATINPSGIRGRERFSIAHEIGHWNLHRGRSFQCRVEYPDANLSSSRVLERVADNFAAHLLMPGMLFNPIIHNLGRPNFKRLKDVADQFQTSLTATVLRLANINTLPIVVACYDKNGFRWSLKADDVPQRWFLKRRVDQDTFTFDLLKSGKECPYLGKQSADAWFENHEAENYEVFEQCMLINKDQVLVILYLEADMFGVGDY